MARKPASRSTAAATTTTLPMNMVTFSNPTNSSIAAYSPSATMTVAGGPASTEPSSPGHSAPVSSTSAARKRAQPRSKNHGRFPCSIPGCYAVANHLSSMCRHKWGHLPQRLLPACRGHLPNGAPCPVRYQGRADTMKRHWITHHTNEGPWVPDRYPPFEDLWKLVRDGEIVLTPPSKYAYDSPLPEDGNTASAFIRAKSGDATGRRNSLGLSSKLSGLSSMAGTSSVTAGARRNSFSGRVAGSPGATVRLSRGNNKPWRISDVADGSIEVEEEGETDEPDATMEEEYIDIEMEDATRDESVVIVGRNLAVSPHHSTLYSPAHSHYSRSQRSNSNPLSPDSMRSAAADNDVHIQVPLAIITPITPRTSSSGESIIAHRYPLLPASNYPVLPTSSIRDNNYDTIHGYDKSKSSGGLGLLALSAMQEHRHIHDPENQDPNPQAQVIGMSIYKLNNSAADAHLGQYVYSHKKGSPPGPGYTPASIPHSELSLLSHPPTDRILPSQNSTATANDAITLELPKLPRRASIDSSPFAYSYASHGIWTTHGQSSLSRPVTVASH